MTIDITKLIGVIGLGMQAVEKIKSAKGKEKEAAVIEVVKEQVPDALGIVGVNFNEPALQALLENYIAARVALANGIANAKALKPAA